MLQQAPIAPDGLAHMESLLYVPEFCSQGVEHGDLQVQFEDTYDTEQTPTRAKHVDAIDVPVFQKGIVYCLPTHPSPVFVIPVAKEAHSTPG
jgi:hypothetical protein